jgi:hypothetical protein
MGMSLLMGAEKSIISSPGKGGASSCPGGMFMKVEVFLSLGLMGAASTFLHGNVGSFDLSNDHNAGLSF